MYVPSESIYYEIITDKENKTLEHMLNKKVIPVSPSIFYAQLSVFNMAFKTIQFERNVLQIVNSLSRLLNEFNMITSEFETLGKHINNAQSKYLEVDKKLTQFGNSFMQIAKYGTVSD
ncbi:MAG: DNA recombination protein RmuC [Candidatus Kryptonium sp.]